LDWIHYPPFSSTPMAVSSLDLEPALLTVLLPCCSRQREACLFEAWRPTIFSPANAENRFADDRGRCADLWSMMNFALPGPRIACLAYLHLPFSLIRRCLAAVYPTSAFGNYFGCLLRFPPTGHRKSPFQIPSGSFLKRERSSLFELLCSQTASNAIPKRYPLACSHLCRPPWPHAQFEDLGFVIPNWFRLLSLFFF